MDAKPEESPPAPSTPSGASSPESLALRVLREARRLMEEDNTSPRARPASPQPLSPEPTPDTPPPSGQSLTPEEWARAAKAAQMYLATEAASKAARLKAPPEK